MNVIAIDPGSTHSALVGWNGEKILDIQYLENLELLNYLSTHAIEYSCLAIEKMALYQACDQHMHDAILFCGRFVECWDIYAPIKYSKNVHLVFRKTYYAGLTGQSKSNDQILRSYLIDRFGDPGNKRKPNPEAITYGLDVYVPDTAKIAKGKDGAEKRKLDCWQAFGLAVYLHDEITAGRIAA